MKKSRLVLAIILTILTVSLVAFIFYNSMQNAVDSAEESDIFLIFFNNLFSKLSIPIVLTDFMIRKAAHFCEYFVLGFMLNMTLITYTVKYKLRFILSLSIGAVIAVCDELIQLSSLGRSCELRDMIIDFTGVLIISLIIFIISICKEKRGKMNGQHSS